MRWENLFHCEIDPFCRNILKHYWPYAQSFKDITTLDATEFRGRVDVLSGGFPCQPFSIAGKRKGTDDNRYLWPHMRRIISEIQPRYVVAENVPGLINWNEGMVFEQVHLDLEAAGFQVQTVVLPAAGVGAPHRRDRVWFIAYSNNDGSHGTQNRKSTVPGDHRDPAGPQTTGQPAGRRCPPATPFATHADSQGLEGTTGQGIPGQTGRPRWGDPFQTWDTWPSESPVCGPDDGLSAGLDGITFSKWRTESLRAYGNAIVPQVAYQIFSVIAQLEQQRY